MWCVTWRNSDSRKCKRCKRGRRRGRIWRRKERKASWVRWLWRASGVSHGSSIRRVCMLRNCVGGVHGIWHHAHSRHSTHILPLRIVHSWWVWDWSWRMHLRRAWRALRGHGTRRRQGLCRCGHSPFQLWRHMWVKLIRVWWGHLLSRIAHGSWRWRRHLPNCSVWLHSVCRLAQRLRLAPHWRCCRYRRRGW